MQTWYLLLSIYFQAYSFDKIIWDDHTHKIMSMIHGLHGSAYWKAM